VKKYEGTCLYKKGGAEMGQKIKTGRQGVRYRSHPTRKNGVQYDRCFFIRHKVNGKLVEESVGWASDGWTAADAANLRAELQRNKKTGQGPRTLAEKRELEDRRRDAAKKEREKNQRLDISFKSFFDDIYFPDAKTRWKSETARKAKEQVNNWIDPVTGSTPIRHIGLDLVKKIRANLSQAGRSPRTQQYVFRTFSMVWDAAADHGLVNGPSPTKTKSFRLPKVDNERQRYLTNDEEKRLLNAVKNRSDVAYHITILSLDTGMRFKEIARLSWGNVDLYSKTIRVLDSKGKDRYVPMTARVVDLFESMDQGTGKDLVFPARGGNIQYQIPSSFVRGVADAKLNKNIEEPKMRASFHTLRHTYASRLVQAGVDLYRVQRLLGHSTPIMTARYSKLADSDLKNAVKQMEENKRIQKKKKKGKLIPFQRLN
jgi:integrase